MAPPKNLRRRRALTDSAIEILGMSGMHELSHRAVDERAGLPAGTTSNYFPSRDDLLEAAARRIVELQVADMQAADGQVAGPVGLSQLAELIGASLYDSATRRRTQFLAIFELTLEATRRPGLGQALAQIAAATLEATVAEHRALGLDTSPEQVQLLLTLFAGALLALVTGPREAVTPGAALTLAHSLVTGALSPSAP
jgi:DNA-binding transcriptional regulator YbjK